MRHLDHSRHAACGLLGPLSPVQPQVQAARTLHCIHCRDAQLLPPVVLPPVAQAHTRCGERRRSTVQHATPDARHLEAESIDLHNQRWHVEEGALMYTTTAQKPITAITRAPIFSADKPGSEPYSSPGPNLRCLRRCQRHRANGQCAGWRLPAARPPPPAAAKRGVLGQPPPGLVEALCRSEGQSPPAMRTVRGKEYAPRLVALLARRGPHRATRRCRPYFSVPMLPSDKIK